MDEETDTELVALQSMVHGSSMAHVALALALLDRGLIERDRLLAIIDSLQTLLEADYHDRLGEPDDASIVLGELHAALSEREWTAGTVVETLRKLESEAYRALQKRRARRKRGPEDPPADGS